MDTESNDSPTGSSSSSAAASGDSPNAISHLVTPGVVMHLFPRYGYLSLSMRVVPRNDSQSWIFLEPTRDVMLQSTTRVQEQSFTTPENNIPLHNEFHIDLCEDIQQLVQAYFRRFLIEGLEKPWHAFAGGWRGPSLAKYFGLDPSYVKGDYRYMLVRVLMVRNTGKLQTFPNVTIQPNFMENVRSFRANDYTASFKFFNEVGTHFVNSFITGNAIYQVNYGRPRSVLEIGMSFGPIFSDLIQSSLDFWACPFRSRASSFIRKPHLSLVCFQLLVYG